MCWGRPDGSAWTAHRGKKLLLKIDSDPSNNQGIRILANQHRFALGLVHAHFLAQARRRAIEARHIHRRILVGGIHEHEPAAKMSVRPPAELRGALLVPVIPA